MYCNFFIFFYFLLVFHFKRFFKNSPIPPWVTLAKMRQMPAITELYQEHNFCHWSLPRRVRFVHFPLPIKNNTKNSRLPPLPTKTWNNNPGLVEGCPGREPRGQPNSPRPPPPRPSPESPAPSGALSTCCPGGWRRRGARSAARSWAAGSGRTSGRRSAPRRPSPPLPSSAAHVPAPAREQRRGPAWTSTGTPSPAGRQGPSTAPGGSLRAVRAAGPARGAALH